MFHANAWGTPYAALMAGADLLMPDRFLQAERLVEMIETHRPTVSRGTDDLERRAAIPALNPGSRHLVAAGGALRRLGCSAGDDEEFQDKHGVEIRQAWGMTETSPLASIARPPGDVSDEEHWALRNTAGRPMCGVEARIVDDDGNVLPNDGKAVGRWKFAVPG